MDNKGHIGIVGTGMIASSMATLCTGHGFQATVFSRSEKSTQRCFASYKANFRQMIKQGLITDEQAEICASYLSISTDFEALVDSETVFECIAENLDDKQSVYKKLEKVCPKLEAICSVSSSIVPDLLSDGMDKYGDRIVVTHPFNPAHMVPYFELCASEKTAEGVMEYVVSLMNKLDRKPVILKRPTPGFIGNRLQFALLREALKLVESGIADPQDIDTCLNYSFCPRYTSVGIFEHFDNGGLELCSTVCANLFPILSDDKTTPKIITEKIAQGNLGPKTGKGFYDWRNVDMEEYQERVNKPYWNFCRWDYPVRKNGEN